MIEAPTIRILGPEDLPPECWFPADHDPLANGILMAHQKAWIEDPSPLKLCRKGRRTGITYAEALDDTLIAAASKEAGGDNVFYIPDAKEKGLEFIGTAAHFARVMGESLSEIEEYLFEDERRDGESKHITSWRIRFKSGFRINALSSRPAAVRGLQGIVVMDEVAFHDDPRAMVNAANALLIWGGKLRMISSPNGTDNAFNDLEKEALEGDGNGFNVHHYSFFDAVRNGLYLRVCLKKGWTPSEKAFREWYRRIIKSYGSDDEARNEELGGIPRQGGGVFLPLAVIEARADAAIPLRRWKAPDDAFLDRLPDHRRIVMAEFITAEIDPILASLADETYFAGLDFGLKVDKTVLWVMWVDPMLARRTVMVIELTTCPYDQQEQVVWHVLGYLRRRDTRGRLGHVTMDANGSGATLAQRTRQWLSPEMVTELIPSEPWYREIMTPFRTAFTDGGIDLPADRDVRDDFREIKVIKGVAKIPRGTRKKGQDDTKRHGDTAMACVYAYAASRQPVVEYDYIPATGATSPAPHAGGMGMAAPDDDDFRGGGWDGVWSGGKRGGF